MSSAIASEELKSAKAAASNAPSKQAEIPRPDAGIVNIQCVNAEGQPVADAEVHLFQHDGDAGRYVPFGPFKSNEHGKLICAEEVFTDRIGNFDRWIYARIPGRLVGVARCTKWTNRKAINPEGRVRLYPSTSVNGVVTVPEDFDRTKVKVVVRSMWITTGEGFLQMQGFPRDDSFPGLDTALPEIFECFPDAEGRIQFGDLPRQGRLFLVTIGDGLAEAQWANEGKSMDNPIELTIARESALTGKVLMPNETPAAGLRVGARLADRSGAKYLTTFRTTTDQIGEFVVHGLPEKEFVLHIDDPKHEWIFRPLENPAIPPGESRNLTVNLEKGVLVSGRVFDPEGKPMEGAFLSAIGGSDASLGLGEGKSDAEGRYRFQIPTGRARFYFNSVPDGFDYPKPHVVTEIDVEPGQADIERLNFFLPRKHDGSSPTGEQPPKLPPPSDEEHWHEFQDVYGLHDGEILKRIDPLAVPECRWEYWRRTYPERAKDTPQPPVDAQFFRWENGEFKHWDGIGVSGGQPGVHSVDLPTILQYTAGIPGYFIEGDEQLIATRVIGDFVYREGATQDDLVSRLSEILVAARHVPVRLTLRDRVRKVFVVRGTFEYAPLTDKAKGRIILGGRPPDGDSLEGGGGGSGDFNEFLKWLSSSIGFPVVSEVAMPPERLAWHVYTPDRAKRLPADTSEEPDLETAKAALQIITEQTGLSFSGSIRKVRVVLVQRTEQ